MRTRARSRGFTLIELSVVVVIVGVLAVIGMVGYRRYRASARMSEATNMIAAIRAAQAEYKAETGVYANVSNDINSLYPDTNPGPHVTQWGGACNVCKEGVHGWQRLKVQTPGPVMYGYATVAGVGGTTVSSFMAPAMTAPSNEGERARSVRVWVSACAGWPAADAHPVERVPRNTR